MTSDDSASFVRAAGAKDLDMSDLGRARRELDVALRERGHDRERPAGADGESSVPSFVAVIEPVLSRLRALRHRLDPL